MIVASPQARQIVPHNVSGGSIRPDQQALRAGLSANTSGIQDPFTEQLHQMVDPAMTLYYGAKIAIS